MGLFNNMSSDTTAEYYQDRNRYNTALNQANDTLNNVNKNINQYTGNQGFNNSIEQGLKGANVTANNAGAKAQTAARNAGMTKAQAAALGSSAASSAYGNNFNNQQNLAYQSGLSNLGNNLALAGQQNAMANTAIGGMNPALAAQTNAYNRSTNNLTNIMNGVGTAASIVGPMIASAMSDERCKEHKQRVEHISDMVANIPSYMYKYTPEAQKAYPEMTDNETKAGVMAQDLEKNPVTATAVKEDENGVKTVDTKLLSLQAIGLISDLAKRVQELEDK